MLQSHKNMYFLVLTAVFGLGILSWGNVLNVFRIFAPPPPSLTVVAIVCQTYHCHVFYKAAEPGEKIHKDI